MYTTQNLLLIYVSANGVGEKSSSGVISSLATQAMDLDMRQAAIPVVSIETDVG